MRVLVIGGSGVAGRPTAAELARRGHEVAVLSRRGSGGPPGASALVGDIATGADLERALAGIDCVVDCANVRTTSRRAAVAYFAETTRRLGRLGSAAGVRHHIVLGIVGSDIVPFGYYEGKVVQEAAALEGPVPATVVRATQFHEFAEMVLRQFRIGPVSAVPRMLMQPIAASQVGQALADAVEAGPAGRAPDIAGPQQEHLPDLARRLVRARGERRLVVPLRLPGKAGQLMRTGALLPGPDAVLGGPTFSEWLARRS